MNETRQMLPCIVRHMPPNLKKRRTKFVSRIRINVKNHRVCPNLVAPHMSVFRPFHMSKHALLVIWYLFSTQFFIILFYIIKTKSIHVKENFMHWKTIIGIKRGCSPNLCINFTNIFCAAWMLYPTRNLWVYNHDRAK